MQKHTCRKCGQTKSTDAFTTRSDNGKLRNTCRDCINAASKARREQKR